MLQLHKVHVAKSAAASVAKVLSSGWIGEGPLVEQFEEEVRKFLGNPYVTVLNSGTSSLMLALRLAGIGPGDEVITTPMTCMATNQPVLLTGGTLVWSDIDPKTGNISPESVLSKITPRTKAIMVVHWGGYPVNMEKISEVAKKGEQKFGRRIFIIQDAAHAFGSAIKHKKIGVWPDFTCFSFQAIKHITTGDGGAIAVTNKREFDRCRSLKWFGIDREARKESILGHAEYDILEAGYKFHMNDIAAAIGLEGIKEIDSILEARARNAKIYYNELSELDKIELQKIEPGYESGNWLFPLLVDDRIKFIKYMRTNGVEAGVVHIRNDSYSVLKNYSSENLPGLDSYSEHMVCIPIGQWITKKDAHHITKAIKKYDAMSGTKAK